MQHLQRPLVLIVELPALEDAGGTLSHKLDVQRAPAPGVVAVGALAGFPVVPSPDSEGHASTNKSAEGSGEPLEAALEQFQGWFEGEAKEVQCLCGEMIWLLR